MIDFAVGKEREISALPQGDQMHEGKRFATTEQWMKMPPSRRESHWKLEPQHIKTMYVSDLAKQAKEKISAEKDRFNRYVNKSSGNKKSQPRSAQPFPVQSRVTKPQPPATSCGPAVGGLLVSSPNSNPASGMGVLCGS